MQVPPLAQVAGFPLGHFVLPVQVLVVLLEMLQIQFIFIVSLYG